MMYEKIDVKSYAGYKAEESPRAFNLGGRWIVVWKITDQWVEEKLDTRQRLRCFRVRGSDWKTYVLCYDEEKKEWLYLHEKE